MENKETRYRWIQATLAGFRYLMLGKADKGLLVQYPEDDWLFMTQVKRLIEQYREWERLERNLRTAHGLRSNIRVKTT